jgi:hypothetical protein
MNPSSLVRQGNRYYDPEEEKYYRYRRGELVEIPPEWVNKVPTPATIRRRSSRLVRKLKTKIKRVNFKGKSFAEYGFIDDVNHNPANFLEGE